MPSQFVKVQLANNFLLDVSSNAFPSGAGFFSLTSSQYFPPRIPLGWWVYDGTLDNTSSQLFNEGVVVPGQGDITETTGSLIHTGSTEFTGSVNVSNELNVIGTASVAEIVWDGSAQNLSLFSSSVSSEFDDIDIDSGSFDSRVDILELSASDSDIDSGSFDSRIDSLETSSDHGLWTGSADGAIERVSDVRITGSLNVTETGSFGFLEVNGDTIITETLEVTKTGSFGRVEATSSRFGETINDLHEFTGSINLTGSFSVEGTASVGELAWDGSVQNLSLFSSSVSSEFGDINIDSGSFDSRVDILELSASDSDIDSGSFDSRIDILELSESLASGTLWTGSISGTISRESNVQITGNLDISGNITAQEFHTDFVSSSIIFISGSTKFGDTLDDQHSFTGSVEITGSLNVVGTASVGELAWDGSVQNLSLFSSSISSVFADIEIDSGSFDSRVDILELSASDSDIDSGSFDSRVDILELSASDADSEFADIEIDSGSFDSRVDILELSASDSDIDSGSFDIRIDSLETEGFLFQAIHTGSTDVNDITPVVLSWDTQDLLDSPFTHSTVTNPTQIQVGISAWYDVSYSILTEALGNSRTSILSVIRLDGFTNIQTTQVVAYKRNILTGGATTNVWNGLIQLSSSNFIELILSNAGGSTNAEVNTIPSASLFTMRLVREL